ncbi:carboxylesterase 3 [Austrofundulus limnaeus]|uniref:Carboxylic ester hydrolase n=1 Tax=Austrofundulus limnaeus TaxID=52670 RepID=A0A2I4D2A3_AUSLI|nr:PREDICTED: carboxylesterase 5A-like [Austrofundulus limnaeus]
MRTVLVFVVLLPALLVRTHLTPGALNTGPGDLVVSLRNGPIRGQYQSVKGTERRVRQYLGVPFARPPTGPLRLTAPQSVEPWEEERDCTQHPPMCVQDPELVVNVSRIMSLHYTPPEVSEDCLYLNLYTPAEARPGDKLPVMFWIHGGGLMMGAASQFDGSALAAYENIVVVIIQYRLGILGFLSTGDQHARGNWGLLDQLAALRWVQENIESFGGDPQRVTIAGESAGAISASILTLSPQAKGLFHGAIFQSGVSTIGSYTSNQPLVHTQIIANITGCSSSSSEEMVHCIRTKSKEQLIDATKKVKKPAGDRQRQMKIFLGGVVDNDFLHGTAEELLSKKEVLQVPVMMGITNHEFGWILPQSFLPPGWENGMNQDLILTMVNMFNPSGVSSANRLITEEYLKEAQSPEEVRDRFLEVMGDLLMTLPVLKVAKYHAEAGAPVFMYEFVYRAAVYQNHRPSFVKADHGDDVVFMFGGCFFNGHVKLIGNISKQDEQFCRTMMSYWASFVRTGSPNGPGLVSWPQYNQNQQDYMELGLTPVVKQKLKMDRVQFSTVTLPQKLEQLAAAAAKDTN